MVGFLTKMREGLFQRPSRRVTLGVQAVVVDTDRHVLLVRHRCREGWHFPGGGVERGETLEAALARELQEEAGIVPKDLRLFGIYSHFDTFPGDHIVLFVVGDWTRRAGPSLNLEIAEQGFFALNALPEAISRGTKRRLDEVFAGAECAESW
jgi:8-oxo-dGTP pyrophosphatase MutT (NUDIX family)